MKTKFLSLIALSLVLSSHAEAAHYFRFWRGYARTDLTHEQVRAGLNEKLLPATGKLAQTAAQLRSYEPVLIPADVADEGVVPAEIALVEYEDEAGYTAYRSTPEGKAYGDLHWDIFDKSRSKSLVPERFAGSVDFEHAYDLVGADASWEASVGGETRSRIFERIEGQSDGEFLAFARSRIAALAAAEPRAAMVLVARDYLIEYVAGGAAVESAGARVDVELQDAGTLEFGTGVVFPVTR